MATMRDDYGNYLRLTAREELSVYTYEAIASINGRVVANDGLSLLGVPEFLAALAAFERTREGRAVLTGTYDFELAVGPHGRTGAALVEFLLADYLWLPVGRHGRHLLQGALEVPGERVGTITRELTELLTPGD